MSSSKPKILLGTLSFVLVSAAFFALYITAVLSWSYSKGDRAGFLQKVSQKGWVCKTWEGQLSMVALPGAAPEQFLFTIREENIAKQVNNFVGKRVVLSYEEHKGLPTSCLGDTDYFIVGVKEVAL